jgi:hypothetical protein
VVQISGKKPGEFFNSKIVIHYEQEDLDFLLLIEDKIKDGVKFIKSSGLK